MLLLELRFREHHKVGFFTSKFLLCGDPICLGTAANTRSSLRSLCGGFCHFPLVHVGAESWRKHYSNSLMNLEDSQDTVLEV